MQLSSSTEQTVNVPESSESYNYPRGLSLKVHQGQYISFRYVLSLGTLGSKSPQLIRWLQATLIMTDDSVQHTQHANKQLVHLPSYAPTFEPCLGAERRTRPDAYIREPHPK